jgi:hypothetical protein
MNRFQMLKKQEQENKPVTYSFNRTSSPVKVLEYLKRCLQDGVSFDASNIYPSVVDQALARFYTEIRIPIVTKTEKMMRVLSLTHNLQKVYSVNNIPSKVLRVICYWDLNPKNLPKNIEVAVQIKRRNADKE